MSISALDREIFATNRRAILTVVINGVTVCGGQEPGSISAVEVDFDIEQIPPTASITFLKEPLSETAAGLPTWVMRGHEVDINAGYGGEVVRIFTGRIKKRRRGISEDILDCVGRTGKLTRPYRVSPPKIFGAVEARAAILDILNDYGVDFTEIVGEKIDIDRILMNGGNPWIMGTVVNAVMDLAPPSDMIRKIADVYGHRMYELPDGTLKIRPLLEAPAMSGIRTYTTSGTGVCENTQNTLTYSDTNIDAAALLGNAAANTRRSQGFLAAVSGSVASVRMWLRKVGSPTDRVRIQVFRNASGLPSKAADAQIGSGGDVAGQPLDTVSYTPVTVIINSGTQLVVGTTYHLVVDRTGALDSVNYYEVGIDQTTPGYADGQAGVFGGTDWVVEDPSPGDGADHPFRVVTDVLAAARVLSLANDEDEDQIKKLVIVEGASIPGTDADGNEIVTTVTATATTDNDDIVAGLDELFALEYQNHLIDTAVVAGEVALRLIDKFGRALQSIEIEVPFDPRMIIGATITIDDPEVTGLGGNWWVHGYQHSLSPTGATTHLSLFGGDQSGVSGQLAPQAAFTWTIERELIGTAVQALITFTAVASDLDGWITNYRWVDDYEGGANDVSGGDLTTVTFAYNPTVDPAISMRLTVTDNDGNVTSVTHTIDITTNNENVYLPLITCAAGNTCMYSSDGAVSWRDIAIPSGETRTTEIMLAYNIYDPPILLYGTTTGRIYRSVDDNVTLSLVLDAGTSHPIVDLMQDRPNRVWALTSTGRVYVSHDLTVAQNEHGLNWTLYANLASGAIVRRHNSDPGGPGFINPAPSSKLMGSEPIVNRIWVMGGVGTDPATWFVTNYLADGPNIWWSEIVPGDGAAVSTGNAAHTAVDAVVSHRVSGDLGLGFSGRSPPYIYAAPRFYETPADWVNGTAFGGLPALDCRGLANNHDQDQVFGMVLNSRDFFRCTDGFTWEQLVNVLPGTSANRPHDLLGLSTWRNIFLSAMDEGIAKTINNGSTWAFLRPNAGPGTLWPTGAIGWDVDIEYRRPRAFNVAAIVEQAAASPATETALAIRTIAGGWKDHGPLPTGFTDRPHRLWHFPQISDQVLFHVRYNDSGVTDHSEVLYRTANQGATWVSKGVAPMLFTYAMARGPNGHLWATGESHAAGHFLSGHYAHEIFRSIDDGDTWQKMFEDTSELGGSHAMYKDIAVDPVNPDRVMAVGVYPTNNIATLHSTEATLGGSATWTRNNTGLTGVEGAAARYCTPFIIAGQNERWIIGFEVATGTGRRIYTNDQNGVPAAWTLRYDVSAGVSTFGFADRLRAGNILYVAGSQINSATQLPILRSLNNGNNWEIVATHTAGGAIAWDAESDMLILGRRTIAGERFPYYQPPVPDAVAQPGIDDGLAAAMGWTAEGSVVEQGMAILKPSVVITSAQSELWAIAQNSGSGGDTDIWLREAISNSWRNYLDMPDTTSVEERFGIYHFPGMGDVMFRLKIGDLGSSLFGYGGPLERSADRGRTWTTVLANAGAVARAPNGYMWASADDRVAPSNFQPRSIYRSIDNGENWQLQATDTSGGSSSTFSRYKQIRIDPNNAARVMVVGNRSLNTMRYGFSSTGLNTPATFTFASGPMSFREGDAAGGIDINLEAGGNGRFIIGLSQQDGLAKFIFVTDNNGANWVQKYTVVTTAIVEGWADSVRAGSDLYMAGNGGGATNAIDGRVVRSTNNGDTWTAFTGDDRTSIVAITWHGETSTLFIGRAVAADNNVLRMPNPTPTGTWTNHSIPSDPRRIMMEGLEVVA